MEWVRRFSLVKRVVAGMSVMSAGSIGLGATGAWAASHAAAAYATPLALATGGVALFGALATWAIVSSIKSSVEPTVQAVIRIAGGDLETKIESTGKDEISWLRYELNSMRKKLRTMVLDVRQTADGVGVASVEIASGNTDLSSRTESQASALQQTASSMQHLAQSVQETARTTQEARHVVQASSRAAEQGAQTMQQVVERMGEINTSASRIGEIIGVIDGIAFQTNILALNAAVEAARAGEHGRGFAVVASEVRALAQRSSTAAREIKTLISDSSSRVDAGSRLVDEAGGQMKEILASVQKANALIGEIAEAGQTQGEGLAQVNQAVAQIDTVTQQNAALVEQLAAAAQSLKDQSGRLGEAMSSFRVAA